MKEVKYYCDCCEKEIEGLKEYERALTILIKDFAPINEPFQSFNDSKDVCKDCYYEIMKATYKKFQELKI